MKAKYGVCLSVLASTSLLAIGEQPATAQTTIRVESDVPAAVAKAAEARQAHYVVVRNASPRIMAWWLDPLHNPVPIEFAASMRITGSTVPNDPHFPSDPPLQTGTKSKGGGVFRLPEGVDQILAIDTQNALLVYGTAEGMRNLQTIISYLDCPLRQIKFEVQFVTIDTSAVTALGIDWSGALNGPFGTATTGKAVAAPATFSLGYVRGNVQATLKTLINQGKVKVISSPRVTAINNNSASLYTSVSTPVVLGLKDNKGDFKELIDATNPSKPAQIFYLTTNIGITVTPTINNDDTITAVLQPLPIAALSMPNGHVSLPLATQFVQTIANIRDGDTIAIGGLSAEMMQTADKLLTKTKDKAEAKDTTMIFFVTARIIRRADDAKAMAPTAP